MKFRLLILLIEYICQGETTVELFGAGASFPREVYAQWISLYKNYRFSHVHLDMQYESVGSGAGKSRIKAEPPLIHYAGSDTPLTETEMEEHPDLIMFQTVAGAIVVSYNIPGIDSLTLDLDVLVDIYTGNIRKWNDIAIVALNPNISIPDEDIIPLARADKSGTTSVFTSALTARSKEWRDTYGTFSEGYNSENRQPYHWNSSVVKFFGRTNEGMSGLIMSIDYSMAYISASDAYTAKLNIASLKNAAGNVVNVSTETVQSAMSSANGSISIVNTPAEYAYPIASYTYFILQKSGLSDCKAAIEFVRYVDWFLRTEKAQRVAIELFFVPLEHNNIEFIKNNYLKTITCRGNNVWKLLQRQIAEEAVIPESKVWSIPTYVSLSLFLVVATVGGILFGLQQYKIHRELLQDKWKIPSDSVDLSHRGSNSVYSKDVDEADEEQLSSSQIVFRENAWNDKSLLMGTFNEQLITLTKLNNQTPSLTLKNRRLLLWMRDNVKHNNVMPLLGLLQKDGIYYTVLTGHTRGTLSDILKNPKIMIRKDGVIALLKSLTKGLHYLHRKNIVHGRLSGKCCLIDFSWTMKIASWEETACRLSEIDHKNRVLSLVDGYGYCEENAEDQKLLWVAPEILKFNRKPTQASDVYSYSMVLQELFSKDVPFSELNMPVSDVINAVLKSGIRPRFASSTSFAFRMLMERCWDNDPDARSNMSAIETSVFNAHPKEKSLIDCIFSSVEQYARTLEGKLNDIESSLRNAQETIDVVKYSGIPSYIKKSLKDMGKFDTTIVSDVCVLVYRIASFNEVLQKVTKNGIAAMLNHFYTGIDQLLNNYDIVRVNRCGVESTYIIGIESNYTNSKNTCDIAAQCALKLKQFTGKFRSERLQGMDCSVQLQIGIASGDVIVGVIDKTVPTLSVFGSSIEKASNLAKLAEPGHIVVSAEVGEAIDGSPSYQTSRLYNCGEIVYTLEEI